MEAFISFYCLDCGQNNNTPHSSDAQMVGLLNAVSSIFYSCSSAKHQYFFSCMRSLWMNNVAPGEPIRTSFKLQDFISTVFPPDLPQCFYMCVFCVCVSPRCPEGPRPSTVRPCQLPCKKDCIMTPFSDWTPCPTTCDSGREKKIDHVQKKNRNQNISH